jgi:phosphotransferase system  glucose/maltose/N-acetylglucosamine-specific IIC component
MILNWKVNTIIGSAAFLLTFFFSIANNTWQTSIFRAIIGFLFFFLLSYIFRFIVGQMNGKDQSVNVNPIHEQQLADKLDQEQVKPVDEMFEEEPLFQQIPLQALHRGEQQKS